MDFKPTHVSHKQVEAYQIKAGEVDQDRSAKWALSDGRIVRTPPDFVARGVPEEGDYLVRYAPDEKNPDGYLSWSPRAPFEDGHSEVRPAEHHKSYEGGSRGLTFGQAIEQLKAGDRVARDGWNGKGMFLVLVPGSVALNVDEGRPLAKAGVPVGTVFNYLPHIDMWTAQGDLVPWLASQTDVLAEDWAVVAANAPRTLAQQDTRSRGEPRVPRID